MTCRWFHKWVPQIVPWMVCARCQGTRHMTREELTLYRKADRS